MNEILLHYTQFPSGRFAVSASGITVTQLKHYAKICGFFVVTAPHATQLFFANRIQSKIKLFVALESAGYSISVTSSDSDIFPPMPLLPPEYYAQEDENLAELNALAGCAHIDGEEDYQGRYLGRNYSDGGVK